MLFRSVSYLTEVAGDEANIIFGNVESEDIPEDEVSITIIATGLHDVSGTGTSKKSTRPAGSEKPENGPTYNGQAIKTAPSKRAEQPNNSSRSYDAGDMEIKIPEFLQKRR